MERILKKTIRDIRLDTKSLARLADTLDRDGDGARVTTSDTSTEIEGLVEMGDETCTMDPVDDQTTREYLRLPNLGLFIEFDRNLPQWPRAHSSRLFW